MANQSQGNSESGSRGLDQSAKDDSSFVRKLPDGNLLSQILGSSGKEFSDDGQLQQVEETLRSIAAKYEPGHNLDESITRELVSALIPDVDGLSPPLSSELIEWVAKTLFTDPMSHGRLERMWIRLVGQRANGEQ